MVEDHGRTSLPRIWWANAVEDSNAAMQSIRPLRLWEGE